MDQIRERGIAEGDENTIIIANHDFPVKKNNVPLEAIQCRTTSARC